MINRIAIQQWSEYAPWIDNAQIEQDLIICRALVSIFSDEFLASQLAFRGGTALHKLYLSPQSRYSEDIDLVQITSGPIKPIMYRLSEVLNWLTDRVTKLPGRVSFEIGECQSWTSRFMITSIGKYINKYNMTISKELAEYE